MRLKEAAGLPEQRGEGVQAEQVKFFEEQSGPMPRPEASVKAETDDTEHLHSQGTANRRKPNRALGWWHYGPPRLFLAKVPGTDVLLKPNLPIDLAGRGKDKLCYKVQPWSQVLKLSLTPLGAEIYDALGLVVWVTDRLALPRPPQGASIKGIMVFISWYLGYL